MLLLNGDCIEEMQKLIDDGVQVDSVVTDPPYHLTSIVKRFGKEDSAPAQFGTDGAYARASKGFMGKEWDGGDIAFRPETWELALKLLKPGGHLLAFSASRNYHRMAVAIEDAGFEIRDQMMWLYGSGFPKSHNIGKQIDKKPNADLNEFSKALKARRIELGYSLTEADKLITGGTTMYSFLEGRKNDNVYPPNKEYWEKIKEHFGMDSWEKIIENNLKIVGEKDGNFGYQKDGKRWKKTTNETELTSSAAKQYEGWGTALKPAHEPIVMARKPLSESSIVDNVLKHGTGAINIDGCRVEGNDAKYPDTNPDFRDQGKKSKEAIGIDKLSFGQVQNAERQKAVANSSGRFPANVMHDGLETEWAKFFYCPKTSKSERHSNLDDHETSVGVNGNKWTDQDYRKGDTKPTTERKNTHPTVKPVELMKYLCRLVTPKGGTVLDPFMGSGSTGMAAKDEGFDFIGIEKDEEYFKICESRIKITSPLMDFM